MNLPPNNIPSHNTPDLPARTNTDLIHGLTDREAAARLAAYGLNVLPSSRPRSFLSLALTTLREPMFLLLVACSALYLLLGDPGEAAILSLAIAVVIGITIIQAQRTERTLEALRDLSSPRALVVRDGLRKRIAGQDVVPGDVVVISEGDRIPADGLVLQSKSVKVDESLLTGESMAVGKVSRVNQSPMESPGGEDTPYVFSGTMVVQGSGIMVAKSTGQQTEIGRIGTSLRKTMRPPSGLQNDTRRVVKKVAATSLAVSLIVAFVYWFRDGDLLRGVLNGITFAMSTIPEEFPVVLSVFMAIGAWRMSKNRVLTRQMDALEALGSATVMCVDKTGTITENRMTVADLCRHAKETYPPAMSDIEMIRFMGFACDPLGTDPMDVAAIELAEKHGFTRDIGSLIKSYPLERPLLAVGYLWNHRTENSDTGEMILACKGAPESVLGLCGADAETVRTVMQQVESIAASGQRVLALAQGVVPHGQARKKLADYPYQFVGLAGFKDPVREGVPEAMHQCREAGIKIIMITGDYPVTAVAVAREAGIDTAGGILTGSQVAALSDSDLAMALQSVRVLARMVPEQKLRIVRLLQQSGEIVGMTGDGVNDAPALKAAHIGIAMGERGTDVAREAAALVLLDDNFTSIVAAIRQGRRIYDNLQKAVCYIIAIHVPVVGLALLPIILGVPAILWPVHLAFLELVIDPVCSIVFEAEPAEASIMARPPRPVAAQLFTRGVVVSGLLQGVLSLAAVLIMFFATTRMGERSDHARAVAFAGLLFINIALVLSLRSRTESVWRRVFSAKKSSNKAMYWVFGVLATFSCIVLYVPAVSAAFHFISPHGSDLLIVAGVAMLLLIIFDAFKFMIVALCEFGQDIR